MSVDCKQVNIELTPTKCVGSKKDRDNTWFFVALTEPMQSLLLCAIASRRHLFAS
jgi:hypothetical protein